jgi:hypothetical protein
VLGVGLRRAASLRRLVLCVLPLSAVIATASVCACGTNTDAQASAANKVSEALAILKANRRTSVHLSDSVSASLVQGSKSARLTATQSCDCKTPCLRNAVAYVAKGSLVPSSRSGSHSFSYVTTDAGTNWYAEADGKRVRLALGALDSPQLVVISALGDVPSAVVVGSGTADGVSCRIVQTGLSHTMTDLLFANFKGIQIRVPDSVRFKASGACRVWIGLKDGLVRRVVSELHETGSGSGTWRVTSDLRLSGWGRPIRPAITLSKAVPQG